MILWILNAMVKTTMSKASHLHYGYLISIIIQKSPSWIQAETDTIEPLAAAMLSETTLRHMRRPLIEDGYFKLGTSTYKIMSNKRRRITHKMRLHQKMKQVYLFLHPFVPSFA